MPYVINVGLEIPNRVDRHFQSQRRLLDGLGWANPELTEASSISDRCLIRDLIGLVAGGHTDDDDDY